jgi:hypothetical protein
VLNRTTANATFATIYCAITLTVATTYNSLPTKAATIKDKVAHVMLDDGSKNDSFEKFRSELLIKLASHDKPYVEEILSPDIAYAIGGEKGKNAFLQKWNNLAESSSIWNRLEHVLTHGAQFDPEASEFHAPAVSFDDSHSELPQGVVWNKSASLRKAPESASPAIHCPYNEQITILHPAGHEPVSVEWLKVRCANNSVGYMKASDVYSAFDEFAVFKLRQGKWCMTWFGFAELP